VALASLVVGFLLVFGGGMLLLRPRARDTAAATEPIAPPPARTAARAADAASPTPTPPTTAASAAGAPTPTEPTAETAAPSAGLTIGPANISRCFDPGPLVPIPGAQCDRLPALEQYLASKSAEIASCARAGSHGRLPLYLDFRFSTRNTQSWGLPSSTIPNPGDVTACVKQKVLPLPFANIPHEHDRYVLVVNLDW
jgi:hypothetical protein